MRNIKGTAPVSDALRSIEGIRSPTDLRSIGVRLGAVPLYLAVLLQGMPLDRPLTSARSRLPQDAHQQLVERVTTIGAVQSLLPAIAWGTVYLLALFVLVQRSSGGLVRRSLARQWPLAALVVFSMFSVFWSPNLGKVLVSSFHALGITMVAMAAAARCATHLSAFMDRLTFCLSANLLAHLACVALAPDLGIAIDGRWMGMTPHSNTFGSIAWVCVWASTVTLLLPHDRFRWWRLLPLVISSIALFGSGSMTSIVAAFVAVSITLYIRFSRHWKRELKQLANVALVCALVGLVMLLLSQDAFIAAVTTDLGKSSDFTGRSVIWQEAWRLISRHPLLGWGFDDNARVIIETRFIHTSYHNGFLDLAVRGGAMAIGLVLLAIGYLASALLRVDNTWRLVCLPLLVAFLIHNFMEASLFAPRNIMWIAFVTLAFATVVQMDLRWARMRSGAWGR